MVNELLQLHSFITCFSSKEGKCFWKRQEEDENKKSMDKSRILDLLVSSQRYTKELVLFGLVVSHCSYNNSVNQPSGSSLHLFAYGQAVLLISNQYQLQKVRYSRHWSLRSDLLSSSRCKPSAGCSSSFALRFSPIFERFCCISTTSSELSSADPLLGSWT